MPKRKTARKSEAGYDQVGKTKLESRREIGLAYKINNSNKNNKKRTYWLFREANLLYRHLQYVQHAKKLNIFGKMVFRTK